MPTEVHVVCAALLGFASSHWWHIIGNWWWPRTCPQVARDSPLAERCLQRLDKVVEASQPNQLLLGVTISFFVLLLSGAAQTVRQYGARGAQGHLSEIFHEAKGYEDIRYDSSKRKGPPKTTNTLTGRNFLDSAPAGELSVYVPKGRKRV